MPELGLVRVGAGEPELWIVAGVHGDEVEGIACVEDALASIRPTLGTLVGVPVAHPAALRAGTRCGPDGVDLNRTYPGRADGRPTERIAHALWERMQAGAPTALLTLHSWGRNGRAVPHVEHARHDERGGSLAHALGLPFVVPFDWPDGLLPKIAVAAGIASAELELGGLGAQTEESLELGVRAVRAAAGWLGMLDAQQTPAGQSVARQDITSPCAGRVRQLRRLGESVEAGEALCELRGHDGRVLESVPSPVSGWVGVHGTYGYVEPDAAIAAVFETAA